MPRTSPTFNDSNSLDGQDIRQGNTGGALSSVATTVDDSVMDPQAADLISRSPALDMETVQTGIQNFLQELDNLGRAIISSPGELRLSFWVLSALAAAGACEIARRQMRCRPPGLLAAVTNEPLFSWFPEENDLPVEPET
jgi:hypothetical protein